jgi:hypothetical protein
MKTQVTLLLVSLCCSGRAQAQFSPGCPGNDTVYTLVRADTARGFRLVSPAYLIFPPRDFHGGADARVLVDARGNVMPDSTKIIGADSQRDSSILASSVVAARFHPATHNGCSVRAWYTFHVKRN